MMPGITPRSKSKRQQKRYTWLLAWTALRRGKRIARLGWRAGHLECFGGVEARFIYLVSLRGVVPWQPYAEDFAAEDWVVLS